MGIPPAFFPCLFQGGSLISLVCLDLAVGRITGSDRNEVAPYFGRCAYGCVLGLKDYDFSGDPPPKNNRSPTDVVRPADEALFLTLARRRRTLIQVLVPQIVGADDQREDEDEDGSRGEELPHEIR